MENIERYLNALIQRVITGRTPKELRLNGFKRTEYERVMGEMYEAFRLELLAETYSVAYFAAITQKVDEAERQEAGFRLLVGKTDAKSPMFRPLQSLYGAYKRQVEKTAELVKNVNIMKLTQTNSFGPIIQQVPTPQVSTNEEPSKLPAEEIQDEPFEKSKEAEPKQPRRNFNDTNTSHPDEYWGFKEMEEGEGISHSTACKLSKDPDLSPAFRYVGRAVRVDIAMLHDLQRKKTAKKNKPIGDHPKRTKK